MPVFITKSSVYRSAQFCRELFLEPLLCVMIMANPNPEFQEVLTSCPANSGVSGILSRDGISSRDVCIQVTLPLTVTCSSTRPCECFKGASIEARQRPIYCS